MSYLGEMQRRSNEKNPQGLREDVHSPVPQKTGRKGCSVRLAVLDDSNLNLVADKTMTQLCSFISRGEIERFFAQNYPTL